MLSHSLSLGILASTVFTGLANAHMAPFSKAMYCFNGSVPHVVNFNNDAPVKPLYRLTYDKFWMHAENGCNNFPPDEGEFLDLPAGKSFTVEIAANRGYTSLSPHDRVTDWGDGLDHPDDYSINNLGGLEPTTSGCIPSPNLHCQNETMAAGTAFAIAYKSDINEVTPDDLIVFTVRKNTPWKRLTTYDVPAGMPACPAEGCIVVWLWVPNGCGQANMYMFPYRARVITDNTTPKTIGTPKPPVWCEDDPSKCVTGPKQMIIWNQAERNNIEVEGYDLSGQRKSPGYNTKCGFNDGAQNDIFVDSNSHSKRTMVRRAKKNIF